MGLSQNALARKAGVSQSTLWKVEQGGTKAPRIDTLTKIAGVLKCKVQELFRM